MFKNRTLIDVLRIVVSNAVSKKKDTAYKPIPKEQLHSQLKCVNVNPSKNWVDFAKNIDSQVNRKYKC